MSRSYKGRHWEVAIPLQPSCDVNTIPNPTCDQRMEKRPSVLNRKVSALSTQSLDDTEAEVVDRWKKVGKCVMLVRGVTNQFQRLEFARRQCQDHEDKMKSFLENRFEVQHKVMFDPSVYRRRKDSIFLSRDLEEVGKNRTRRTVAQIRALRLTLRDCQSFGAYPDYVQTELSRQGLLERFGAGRVIIRQGHKASRVYFVLGGTVVVTRICDEEGDKDIIMLHKGDIFGDTELFEQRKRNATVTSAKDVMLWSVEGQDFKNAMTEEVSHNSLHGIEEDTTKSEDNKETQQKSAMTSSSAIETFLASLKWFEGIPTRKFAEGPKLATLVYYRNNDTIVKSSLSNAMLYFVRGGKADVLCKVTLEAAARKTRDVSCFDTGMQYDEPGVRKIRPMTGVIRRERAVLSHAKHPVKTRPMSAPAHPVNTQKSILTTTDGKRPKTGVERGVKSAWGEQSCPRYSAGTRPSTGIERSTGRPKTVTSQKAPPNENTTFVKVCRLERGDVYGLTGLYDGEELNTSLVSRGCECVIINKDVFSLLFDKQAKQALQDKVLFYPSYEELKKKLNNHNAWNKYKADTCLRRHSERWR